MSDLGNKEIFSTNLRYYMSKNKKIEMIYVKIWRYHIQLLLTGIYQPMVYTNEQIKQLPVKIIGREIELRRKKKIGKIFE